MANAAALVGTWRMTSWTRTSVATGMIADMMGPDPNGYIAYHADGRMMALVVDRRSRSAKRPPEDGEKAALFDSMLAYAASYTLEDGRVVHHVDASWNPGWGGDLIRPFTLDGDRLVIGGAPGVDPRSGEDVIYRMEFRKVAAQ